MLKNHSPKISFLLLDNTFLRNSSLWPSDWFVERQLIKIKQSSSWRTATVIAGAFLILIISSFGLNWLVTELAWQGQQSDSWWVKGVTFPTSNNYEHKDLKAFPNYLVKPIAGRLNTVADYFKDNFLMATVWAADEAVVLPWQGELVSLSHRQVNIKEGAAITMAVKYKNTGTKPWRHSGSNFLSINVAEPYYHASKLRHNFWYSPDQPAKLLEDVVMPGEVGTFRFALQAPLTPGVYKEYFELAAENLRWLKTTRINITLAVGRDNFLIVAPVIPPLDLENKIISEDASVLNEQLSLVDDLSIASTTPVLMKGEDLHINEPLIRVGLYKTTEPVLISANGSYFIKDEFGNIVKELEDGSRSVITFDSYSNNFMVTASQFTAVMPWAVVSPKSTSTIFTIINYDNHPKWNVSWNDNHYRGNLEVRYGEKSASPWVINELLMEDYIRGIKETSEASPIEYQKAIAVAARTYALWQLADGTKHAGNNFTVDAVFDQVYRGYNAELQVPKFSAAVNETEGLVVTYNNELALTPYFAQSDGRTRSYKEVWFGSVKPWLVSVPDPTNAGLQMWGHGVGMSARGALIMASRQNKTFTNILKYYYTGVEVERWYRSGEKVEILSDTSNEDEPRL